MDKTIETQIIDAEERLRLAMLAADVRALDGLLAPELLFTSHLGQLLGKPDDLAAHESGLFKIMELNPSERRIRLHGGTAIVSIRMQISGTYDGNPANRDFRFTRVWMTSSGGAWHVVAAHACLVA